MNTIKIRKAICILIAFASMLLSLSGCFYKSWLGKRPCDQPGTVWISEDKRITFWIEDGAGIGTIANDGKIINILFAIGMAADITVYPLENDQNGFVEMPYIERWSGSFRQKNKFTAKVDTTTTYFSLGDEIVFYRVDDENEAAAYKKAYPIIGGETAKVCTENPQAREFKADPGTPVYSTMDGEVINAVMKYSNGFIGSPNNGDADYGNYIDILVGDNTLIRYSHLQLSDMVLVGDTVYAGRQIGFVGYTGYCVTSDYSHLHFEIISDSDANGVDDYFPH